MLFAAMTSLPLMAQTAPATTTASEASSEPSSDESTIVLSPFEVSATEDTGYMAATTLAGNRLNTDIRDLGNAVSVVTSRFLKDIGATDNETLLQYTVGTEVGSIYGNFAGAGNGAVLDEGQNGGRAFINPSQNTRVRGLTAADNTRDYFLTDIPWDSYNVDRVDLQRGPNSILFGQGSPAGIINSGTKQAKFTNANEVTLRYGSYGSQRATIDLNHVLLPDELAIRFASVYDDEEFQQKPAYALDKRVYGAMRWEPKFMKKGSARTVIKANFEAGSINSNRPRSLPPIDRITPWFQTGTYAGNVVISDPNNPSLKIAVPKTFPNLNKGTFNGFQLQDDNTGRANHGQERPSINGGVDVGLPNPGYQPWIGNFGQQFGGPLAFFNADGTSANQAGGAYTIWEINDNNKQGGLKSDGTIDGSIGGYAFNRPGAIDTMANYARKAGLPLGDFGIYKDASLTDPSIFDFYNHLIDGPNKKEWNNFRAYNFSLAQTFFNDQAGFELVYNNEFDKNGQVGILSGEKVALNIDINSVYSDGTAHGTGAPLDPDTNPAGNEPFADGTPNPNVGRPFISDSSQFASNSTVSNRESSRLTGFVRHDFTKDAAQGTVWARALGSHTITGLYAQDVLKRDSRQWQRYGSDLDYEDMMRKNGAPNKFNDNFFTPNTYLYLGPSLIDRDSAVGANIPAVSGIATVTSGTVRIYDSTWNAPDVDPAAYWHNDYYPLKDAHGNVVTTGDSTQSEIPANYVGFRNVPYNVIDSEAKEGNRDTLTTSARLTKSRLLSRAFVWQGHFWDNSIVGTFGVRKDIARSWAVSKDVNNGGLPDGHINLDPDVYKLPDASSDPLEVTSHSYSIVTHLNQLPGLSKFADRLPIQVSLFYNKSTDFQPESSRVNLFGEQIAAPEGKTIDKGILLETRDGKYSLKINQYETSVKNASTSQLQGAYFIGASQAWGGNWANNFEYKWTNSAATGSVAGTPQATDPTQGNFTQVNYGQANKVNLDLTNGGSETLEEADAREVAAIAAWRTWQKQVATDFPKFYDAWSLHFDDKGINSDNPDNSLSYSTPNGFTPTEDSTSKGYEIEFSAVPVKNWRLTLNAAKTTARRYNVGGAELAKFAAAYEKALKTTAAGDLRIWWGGAGNETTLYQWNLNVGSELKQLALQSGTDAPEVREWRVNAITNYDFDHGLLKGVNVGGGIRYQSSVIIGYPASLDPNDPTELTFDVAHPYKGPAETNFDFWIGYSRPITKHIDWNLQLNVRNAFVGNELIPITTQPDGTPASYRIRPSQTWQLTSTFRF
jgi:outer membrane receptor protein involved in Fe transport